MTYPKLPGLTWDGTVYENEEMGTIEALIPNGGYPTAHAPAMVELPNGDLLCCWFAGTYEGSADVHIVCSRLPKDGQAWLPPVENKTNNKQYEYPYIMQGKDGMIHLAYAARTRQGVKYVRFTEQDILGEKRERVGLYNPTAAQSR